jgi:hypothetical protein
MGTMKSEKGVRFNLTPFSSCQRDKVRQADLLADHDPQVFDAELINRLGAEPVAGRDQIRVEGRLTPGDALKFVESLPRHPNLASCG